MCALARSFIWTLVAVAVLAVAGSAIAKSPVRTLIAAPPNLAGGVRFAANGGNSVDRPINPGLRPHFVAGYRRNFEACPGGGACRGMQIILYRYTSSSTARHALDVVRETGAVDFKTGLGVGSVAGPFLVTVGDPQGRACYFASAVRGAYYVGVTACRNDVDSDVGLRGLAIQTVKLTVKRVATRG